MHGLVWLGLRPILVLAMLVANVVMPKFPVIASENAPLPTASLPQAKSLADLHQLRDRLTTDLDQRSTVKVAALSGIGLALAATLDQLWAIAAYQYDTARSDFLVPIVNATGMASRVRVTVCTLQRECRRWQGDRPPASPASLIKVPVAIALMTHLHQAGIDPTQPIWVSPTNWTEDIGTTWVGTAYPLKQLMADMLSASSNIATNQLIDYLGWEGVNQPLQNQGYRATRISRKLAGVSTYPPDAGHTPNQLTTDELTDMMVAIYNGEVPHAELIQAALADQRDRALGYAAVPPPIVWLGEKTGRNSQVMGTTTAVSVHGQCYIITATLDHGNEAALRSIMAGVMEHLLTHDGFEPADVPTPAVAVRPQAFLP